MPHMIEILSDLDILTRPVLDLSVLQLDGVPFGSDTRSFPRGKITDVTFSPIVHRYRAGTGVETEYFDAFGRALSLDEVIDSVINSNGMLHFKDKISFKIVDGRVRGFAIFGDQLRHFDYIKSYDDCLAAFGPPSRTQMNEAYGDLMGYDIYYFGSKKHVGWDSFDNRVSLINLGDYEGNTGE
jgi:hypothetical protein